MLSFALNQDKFIVKIYGLFKNDILMLFFPQKFQRILVFEKCQVSLHEKVIKTGPQHPRHVKVISF